MRYNLHAECACGAIFDIKNIKRDEPPKRPIHHCGCGNKNVITVTEEKENGM